MVRRWKMLLPTASKLLDVLILWKIELNSFRRINMLLMCRGSRLMPQVLLSVTCVKILHHVWLEILPGI